MGKDKKTNYNLTYCNPLPMPDYPQGSEVNGFSNCRELADPTVIWHDKKWILYATIGSIYMSEDYVNWKVCKEHKIPKLVAPTVVKHKEQFYLMGSESPVYVSPTPFGPFEELDMVKDSKGEELYIRDPMLFANDDGRLYLYWGLGADGIYGMELNTDNPCQGLGIPVSLFQFNPNHKWERFGAYNQNKGISFVEGAWMQKYNGRYYLVYSAPGTCYRTYALGVYQSDKPLEGFVYQDNNPFLYKDHGLVSGTGHGSIVEGPNHTLWVFYTIKLCYATKYERRIAMDPVGFDEKGNLFVKKVSEIPQWAPGVQKHPEIDNDTPLLPVTSEEQVRASSCASGRDAIYALDDSMLSWWQPADNDLCSTITIDLRSKYLVSAARIIWRDVDLDYKNHVLPGPFQYKIEVCTSEEQEDYHVILDCSANELDYCIDYRTFPEKVARYIRFSIIGYPKGIKPGLISLTVFGVWKE